MCDDNTIIYLMKKESSSMIDKEILNWKDTYYFAYIMD